MKQTNPSSPPTKKSPRSSETSESPEDRATLAQAIRKISASLQHLERSGLNRTAIIVLTHDATKVSKRTIEHVLSTLSDLERRFC